MSTHYTYLLVDFFCIIVPLIFSFHPKIKFFNQWKYFTLPCLGAALFFIIWDALFTHLGIWKFNPDYIIGLEIFNLPLEEVLFFICIPYACVFTYFCFGKFFDMKRSNALGRMISLTLIIILIGLAILNLEKLYTSVTFILLSLLFSILLYLKVNYLPLFFLSFSVVLIPFFVSNGILTGSFIDEPVVIYNNRYNLNIRMITIPLEDTFYGMLLFLMNVAGYEWMREKSGFFYRE